MKSFVVESYAKPTPSNPINFVVRNLFTKRVVGLFYEREDADQACESLETNAALKNGEVMLMVKPKPDEQIFKPALKRRMESQQPSVQNIPKSAREFYNSIKGAPDRHLKACAEQSLEGDRVTITFNGNLMLQNGDRLQVDNVGVTLIPWETRNPCAEIALPSEEHHLQKHLIESGQYPGKAEMLTKLESPKAKAALEKLQQQESFARHYGQPLTAEDRLILEKDCGVIFGHDGRVIDGEERVTNYLRRKTIERVSKGLAASEQLRQFKELDTEVEISEFEDQLIEDGDPVVVIGENGVPWTAQDILRREA